MSKPLIVSGPGSLVQIPLVGAILLPSGDEGDGVVLQLVSGSVAIKQLESRCGHTELTPEQQQQMENSFKGVKGNGVGYMSHCESFRAGVAAQALGTPTVTRGAEALLHDVRLALACSCGKTFADTDELWRHLDAFGVLPEYLKPPEASQAAELDRRHDEGWTGSIE